MNPLCFSRSKAGFLTDCSPPVNFVTLNQIHSADGIILSADAGPLRAREGDWIATFVVGQRIAVKVADCTAILIEGQSDRGAFVAAIHAGWRGTAEGIIEKALGAIQTRMPVVAWLSPSICQSHFEVGEEVLEALGNSSRNYARAGANHNKFYLDLKSFQMNQLRQLLPRGSRIIASSLCTFCQPDFFSYRRAKGSLEVGERHYAWIELLRSL